MYSWESPVIDSPTSYAQAYETSVIQSREARAVSAALSPPPAILPEEPLLNEFETSRELRRKVINARESALSPLNESTFVTSTGAVYKISSGTNPNSYLVASIASPSRLTYGRRCLTYSDYDPLYEDKSNDRFLEQPSIYYRSTYRPNFARTRRNLSLGRPGAAPSAK